jgi:hypothetical protein
LVLVTNATEGLSITSRKKLRITGCIVSQNSVPGLASASDPRTATDKEIPLECPLTYQLANAGKMMTIGGG